MHARYHRLLYPYYTQFELLGTVALAMGLGAFIGIEREITARPAGLRAHMLVAGVAALLVGLGDVLIQSFETQVSESPLQSDPIRIIKAVITRVSFLGAGTIIRSQAKDSVQGLTTAASLLVVAAIGICVALSQLILATGVAMLVLLVLRMGNHIDRLINRSYID